MPGRASPLVNGEYYHIFNRGNNKQNIYLQARDYKRFVQTFYYYQFLGPKPKFSNFAKKSLMSFKPELDNRLVEILCYCLMPNHFHFLVRQLKNNGISTFLSQTSNSYARYFNIKYNQVGSVLQGRFKAVIIENDEQLIHVSRYIHLNPIVTGLSKSLDNYQWSSYSEYIYENKSSICSSQTILNFFQTIDEYKKFTLDQIDYGRSLEFLKQVIIDDE